MVSTNTRNNTPIPNAYQTNLLEKTPILNIDSLDRELNPCINLARHKVEKAMVLATKVLLPSLNPIWKAAIVHIPIIIPSINISVAKALLNIGAFISLGFSFIIFSL